MAHGDFLQGGDGTADPVEAPDVPVEQVVLGLCDVRIVDVIAEVGASRGLQDVVIADDILGCTLHELDLVPEVEAGDATHCP